MRTARTTTLFLVGALLLAACGDEDTPLDAAAEETVTEDDAADEAGDDVADEGEEEGDDDGDGDAAAAVPASVTFDGTELEPLADTRQCVVFPDGTHRILLEVADTTVDDDDPEARMSLVLERDEDGSSVRIGAGLDLPDQINGEWEASDEDAAAAEIDAEERGVATDLPLELRELNYEGDPQPQQRSLTVDIDCT